MHRKTVLFVQEGLESIERLERVVSGIDARLDTCRYGELSRAAENADLAIVMLPVSKLDRLAELEQVLSRHEGVSCLLIVEEATLGTLRLPTRIPCDFAVAAASDGELAVRMRQLLWPGEETCVSDFITVDSMSINLSTYQVHVDGQPVDFTYLEYALLAFLVTHPGHAYSRDTLLRRVWGFEYYGGSRTVDVHVRRVRAKLGTELAARLETVRGVGYMWSM